MRTRKTAPPLVSDLPGALILPTSTTRPPSTRSACRVSLFEQSHSPPPTSRRCLSQPSFVRLVFDQFSDALAVCRSSLPPPSSDESPSPRTLCRRSSRHRRHHRSTIATAPQRCLLSFVAAARRSRDGARFCGRRGPFAYYSSPPRRLWFALSPSSPRTTCCRVSVSVSDPLELGCLWSATLYPPSAVSVCQCH